MEPARSGWRHPVTQTPHLHYPAAEPLAKADFCLLSLKHSVPSSRFGCCSVPLSDNLRSGDDFQKSLIAEGVDFRIFPILRGLVPAVAELDNALPKNLSPTQFGEPTLAHQERRWPRTITWRGGGC